MSQPRHERTSLLSPILAVTAILGSAAAFVYMAVEALGQFG